MKVTVKALIFEQIRDGLVDLGTIRVEFVDETKIYYDRDNDETFRHQIGRHSDVDIDLTALTHKETLGFVKLLEKCDVHGSKILIVDIQKFLKAAKDGIETIRARTSKQAAWMLEHYA